MINDETHTEGVSLARQLKASRPRSQSLQNSQKYLSSTNPSRPKLPRRIEVQRPGFKEVCPDRVPSIKEEEAVNGRKGPRS